jgi:hypothetical protein
LNDLHATFDVKSTGEVADPMIWEQAPLAGLKPKDEWCTIFVQYS